jgi:hypothetical protein
MLLESVVVLAHDDWCVDDGGMVFDSDAAAEWDGKLTMPSAAEFDDMVGDGRFEDAEEAAGQADDGAGEDDMH